MSQITEEEFDEAMACLVDTGEILACCPVCEIALSIEEFNSHECGNCGEFNFQDIKYYPNANRC